jgi:hypothetical protein
MTFAIVFAASFVAVALLTGLAAWARIDRRPEPLTAQTARALMAEEFPGETVSDIWIAGGGQGAVGRAGERALVLFRVGDGYAARRLTWSAALAGEIASGALSLPAADAATPRIRLALGETSWPPGATA